MDQSTPFMSNINYRIPLILAFVLVITGAVFRFALKDATLAAAGMILIGIGGFTYLFAIWLRNRSKSR
jgi:hypothetical protein